jgi:hypothetical protein
VAEQLPSKLKILISKTQYTKKKKKRKRKENPKELETFPL